MTVIVFVSVWADGAYTQWAGKKLIMRHVEHVYNNCRWSILTHTHTDTNNCTVLCVCVCVGVGVLVVLQVYFIWFGLS